jgi:hypothetical protein
VFRKDNYNLTPWHLSISRSGHYSIKRRDDNNSWWMMDKNDKLIYKEVQGEHNILNVWVETFMKAVIERNKLYLAIRDFGEEYWKKLSAYQGLQQKFLQLFHYGYRASIQTYSLFGKIELKFIYYMRMTAEGYLWGIKDELSVIRYNPFYSAQVQSDKSSALLESSKNGYVEAGYD